MLATCQPKIIIIKTMKRSASTSRDGTTPSKRGRAKDDVHQVDAIVDVRKTAKGGREYLVSWDGESSFLALLGARTLASASACYEMSVVVVVVVVS